LCRSPIFRHERNQVLGEKKRIRARQVQQPRR